ncbi:MAG: type I restriction endonuclease subunit R [Candidatus Thiodiazotropha sp.]
MNEGHLESLALEWLEGLGYTCLTGEDVSIGGSQEARTKYTEVVLRPQLEAAVARLNPSAPVVSQTAAVTKLTDYANQSVIDGNREIYGWLRGGVPVEVIGEDGHRAIERLKVIDFDAPASNDLHAVQQFTVHGQNIRRPDVVVFINGLPLVVVELKNPADENADIEAAYNQIQTYKDDIPQLFHFNLLNIISDGINARYGSLTADFSRHGFWRLLGDAKNADSSLMELEVMVRGLLAPETLLGFFRGFVAYAISDGSPSVKVVAQWHQYQGVRKALGRAIDCLENKRDGKGGVVWFTQGSGKSFLAVFYAMALRDHSAFKAPTIVVVTDRIDLDDQLFETFAGCSESLKATPVQADDRDDLRDLLGQSEAGGIYFTTINKFAPKEGQNTVESLCDRENVIVIVDEAHRTQYGFTAQTDRKTGEQKYGLAKHMRDSLPNAIYLGMTGTPVSLDDRDTEAVFGTYVDIYDMAAAQEDKAVVPISYESRVIDLSFNEADEQALREEFQAAVEEESREEANRTISKNTRLEAIAMADGRLEEVAHDLVAHWTLRRESMPKGKAMVVAISREAAVRLYDALIAKGGEGWGSDQLTKGKVKVVMTGSASDPAHFKPHQTNKQDKELLKKRLRDPDDELEMVIVRDMWLTGFDAPPVNTLYVDKPMQGHGLMQAIARVNRVWRDKPGGLVVDYIGLGEELKKAIKTYTRDAKTDKPPVDVSGEALTILLDTIDAIRQTFFSDFDYSGFLDPQIALKLLGPAMNHLIKLEHEKTEKNGDDKHGWTVKKYLDAVARLGKAQALAGTHKEAIALREEIGFFQAIAASLRKHTAAGRKVSKAEKEAALRQLVAKGVIVEGVTDLFGTLGLDKPDIGLLDEAFLEQVRAMPHQNLAAELLQRLVSDAIKARGRKNAMQEVEFTEKLKESIQKYKNRGLTTVQIIDELIKMAKELNAAKPPDDMSDEEWAFYQALATNESAVRDLGDPVLRALAHELTDKLRKSATIDWQRRGSARAKMRMLVKVLLAKYRYPPDKRTDAIDKVITQAELLADDWGFEQPSVA